MIIEVRNIVWRDPHDKPGNNCSVQHKDVVFYILDDLMRNYGVPLSFDWCTRNSHYVYHWDLERRVTRRLMRDN